MPRVNEAREEELWGFRYQGFELYDGGLMGMILKYYTFR